MADQMLGNMTNARWLEITDRDRRELADIIGRWFAEIHAFLDAVKNRPLIQEHAVTFLPGNGKG